MEWLSAKKDDSGATIIPARWLHIHYYEALNILFRFENSMRVFVYAILKNEYGEKWQDCSFAFLSGDSQTIKSVANKRISQAEAFGYLGFDIRAPLMHLTSGELIELIVSDAYWPKFKRYFRGNKEIIKNKLLEIGSVRNSLAHFRPISPDDIELIKQNSRHTLAGVEVCLGNIFSQGLRVPTNTTDPWYESISTLKSEHIVITPFYSSDELWIDLRLSFTSPVLSKRVFSADHYGYMLGKINSPNILTKHDGLKRHVTYLSEDLAYPKMSKANDIVVRKHLHFVFRKDVLAGAQTAVAAEFELLLTTVTEECELLQKDTLARGNIVEPVSGSAYVHREKDKEPRWQFRYELLKQEYQSKHPDEYWGQQLAVSDVVAGLERYPWMPKDISEEELPF